MQKKTSSPLFHLIMTLLLVAGVLCSSAPATANAANAHPLLIEMAASDPHQIVRVIVQKETGSTGAEEEVASLDGRVTQDMHIITAFAAEMTAGAAEKLARTESVRWVSLDAGMS